VIWNGDAGDVWTNDTGQPLYQLIVSWQNTCGTCAQYDHAVGPAWPLPFHRNCRCKQIVILPGVKARPWVDFRAQAGRLSPSQKRALIGASNWKILDRGLVSWEDIVTPYRVRDFREVVALKKLSLKSLTDAGVKPGIAQRALAAVNTPAHQLVQSVRTQLLANLTGVGLAPSQIAALSAPALAARLGIREGAKPRGKVTRVVRDPVARTMRWVLSGWGLPAVADAIKKALAKVLKRGGK